MNLYTWVDISGQENTMGFSSWANEIEAKACAKLCQTFKYRYSK